MKFLKFFLIETAGPSGLMSANSGATEVGKPVSDAGARKEDGDAKKRR